MSQRRLGHWFGVLQLTLVPTVMLVNCSDDEDGVSDDGIGAAAGASGNTSTSGGDGAAAGGAPAAGASAAGGEGGAPRGSVQICSQAADVSQCDPVTAAGCNVAAGETCDHSMALDGFACFPPPNEARAGEPCDNSTLFCGPTTFCDTNLGKCLHYCCSDDDCAEGSCYVGYFPDGAATVGLCWEEYGGACLYQLQGAGGGCPAEGGQGGQGGAPSSGGAPQGGVPSDAP